MLIQREVPLKALTESIEHTAVHPSAGTRVRGKGSHFVIECWDSGTRIHES